MNVMVLNVNRRYVYRERLLINDHLIDKQIKEVYRFGREQLERFCRDLAPTLVNLNRANFDKIVPVQTINFNVLEIFWSW